MKQYAQMTTEERVQYNTSFAAWYANRDQITLCIQQTGGMDSASRASFDAGTHLVMAWPFGPGFQESVDCLPAVRCVPRLMQLTDLIRKKLGTAATAPQQPVIDPRTPSQGGHAADNTQPQAQRPNTPTPSQGAAATTPLPLAHLHIDQLIYLLPSSVAERARSLKAKLDERDINANRAKDMAINGESNDAIAPYAKAASDAQEFVSDTYEMIDYWLAEYVATERYIRTHKPADEDESALFRSIISNFTELAKPFGSLDRMLEALTPYYQKANENGFVDRQVEKTYADYAANRSATPADVPGASASGPESTPAYDVTEYKRIWTYLNRKDVAHTEKRLQKMRNEIDKAISAGMPNIDAMETIYAHEAELVLAEQQKQLNNQEPSLL